MKAQTFRRISLGFFLVLMTFMGYRHQKLGGGPNGSPTVDALCPFGGAEGLYGYMAEGSWIQRLAPSSLILFIAVGVLTVILGRSFCGWICPMGAITEFSSMIARKLRFKKVDFPKQVDKVLRWLKYFLLLLIIYFTWKTGVLVFRQYDPWKAWMHLSAGFSEGVIAFLILIAVILAEFKIERFWCRYLCPLGALLGIPQKVSLTKVHKNEDTCIHCSICDKKCLTSLNPSTKDVVKDADCISCGTCIESCPKPGTLSFKIFNKSITPMMLGIITLVIFTAFWGGSKITGKWHSYAAPKISEKSPLQDVIKGWMTLNDISKIVGLPTAEIKTIVGLPSDTPDDKPIKAISEVPADELKMKLQKWRESNK